MKNLLRNHLSVDCHAIFINKCGDQVTFEGDDKVLEATKFLGRHAVTPAEIEYELNDHPLQKNESFSIATDKGNVHMTLITYRGGKYE